jgi:hypothetical protein
MFNLFPNVVLTTLIKEKIKGKKGIIMYNKGYGIDYIKWHVDFEHPNLTIYIQKLASISILGLQSKGDGEGVAILHAKNCSKVTLGVIFTWYFCFGYQLPYPWLKALSWDYGSLWGQWHHWSRVSKIIESDVRILCFHFQDLVLDKKWRNKFGEHDFDSKIHDFLWDLWFKYIIWRSLFWACHEQGGPICHVWWQSLQRLDVR